MFTTVRIQLGQTYSAQRQNQKCISLDKRGFYRLDGTMPLERFPIKTTLSHAQISAIKVVAHDVMFPSGAQAELMADDDGEPLAVQVIIPRNPVMGMFDHWDTFGYVTQKEFDQFIEDHSRGILPHFHSTQE